MSPSQMQRPMVYLWKPGAPAGHRDVCAEQAVQALADIAERYGTLTAEHAARDVEEQGPAHSLGWAFTFDVATGMHKLHVIEAGDLIRHIAVREIVPDQPAPVRAFVLVRDEAERYYEPTHIALRHPDKRQQVLADVRKEWSEFGQKMDELLALCTVL